MPGVKGRSGGSRTGAGRKPISERKIIIKIPVYQSLIDAKGGREKAEEIMLTALITAPIQ